MGHIIAIANQKGGVAKTTTAVNLAAGLALFGHRTLLVDLDYQANATQSVSLPESSDPLPGTYEVLQKTVGIGDMAITIGQNLDFIASRTQLISLEPELQSDSEIYRLKDALANVDYDYVVLDCPPSLGPFTKNALAAASHVLVPVTADYFGLGAVADIMTTVDVLKQRVNPNLQVLGVLITIAEVRTRLTRDAARVLRDSYGELLFTSVISKSVRLKEAVSHHQSIFEYDHQAANDYDMFTQEVLRRVG